MSDDTAARLSCQVPPQHLDRRQADPWMLDAEAGLIAYDTKSYRIHGIPNNAVRLNWCGLLAYGEDGMVLTQLGRRLLDEWKATPEGQAAMARRTDTEEET